MADPSLLAELERAAGGAHIPFFIDIEHQQLEEPIGLVLDDADYSFEGRLWVKARLDLSPVTDSDQPAEANFRFPNIDRRRTALLSKVTGALRVSFRLFSSSWFDTAKDPRTVRTGLTPVAAYEAYDLDLIDVSVTPSEVSGRLQGYDYRSEAVPARRTAYEDFPGAFFE